MQLLRGLKDENGQALVLAAVALPVIISFLGLAIDVGNTHITIGVFKDSSLLRTWRLHTNRDATSDELGLLFANLLKLSTRHDDGLKGVCLASVVPALCMSSPSKMPASIMESPRTRSMKVDPVPVNCSGRVMRG